jgi:REP element-mobilizing transposase RayT
MARPLRLEHPGALWHVTSRGNERRTIFRDDADRSLFLAVLAEVVELFAWRLHAYVLMGNHYHLLLETPDPNLSRGMHRINAVYSQWFNRRHERAGHLLQGRFKAILVEKERHLLELVRYVVLNPVRASLVSEAGDWPWSNYLATAGLRRAPAWLETEWTIGQFGGGNGARTAYREFVAAGSLSLTQPWKNITGQLFLGGETFRKQMLAKVEACGVSREVPRRQRLPSEPALPDLVQASARVLGVDAAEIAKQRRSPLRLAVAYLARHDTLTKLSDLGAALRVSASSACEISASAERLRRQAPEFRRLVRMIRLEIRKIET